MADPGEDEDYDLKDEELVDFEGSDYGFESAEEEDTVVASGAPIPAAKSTPTSAPGSGEIVDVKDKEGDGVIVQTPLVAVVDRLPKHRLPSKSDLEDGELDDAAMPEASDPEAVANVGDEDGGVNNRHERNRRKDRCAAEGQSGSKGRRDAEEMSAEHSWLFLAHGSDRMHGSQRDNNFRGPKGANAGSFQRGNSGPGIMGPGRSPVSMEYMGHKPLRFMSRGFSRPTGDVVAPGRLNQNEINMQNHIGDSMAVQEHILQHRQLVLVTHELVQQAQAQAGHSESQVQARVQVQARAQVHAHAQVQHAQAHAQAQVPIANSVAHRTSTSGSTMRPITGLDLTGGQVQASHSMLHLHVQKFDAGPRINYPRPLEDFGAQAPQGSDSSVVWGSFGQPLLNHLNKRDRTAAGRQLCAWSPSSGIHHEISNMAATLRRAQGQDRGEAISPLWSELPVGGFPTRHPSPLGVISPRIPVNCCPGIAVGGVGALGIPKRLESLPIVIPNNTATIWENAYVNKVDIRLQDGNDWRTKGGHQGGHPNNGALALSSSKISSVWPNSSPGGQAGNKRSRENGMDRRHNSKPVSLRSVGNGMGPTGNNLIQLGVPVRKSRVLSVSGFPENTSMAVVVEAFEKHGIILDFKQDEMGNVFHITFSSVAEAVSAKRSLHRTLLNGRQITVDYMVQRY